MGRVGGKDNKGFIQYGKHCNRHHVQSIDGYKGRQSISNDKCIICGWDEGYCDRHRVIPELGYTKENIRILCPNHHRLVTFGAITVA